jgi:hypothetical protein
MTMNQPPQKSRTPPKAASGKKTPSTRSAKPASQGGDLDKVLGLIRERPGIRPSEINRLLDRVESDGLRATLIKRGLVRKEKDGPATRYFPA